MNTKFTEALIEVIETAKDLTEKKQRCTEGGVYYDWYCYREQERFDRANADLSKALEEMIDARVKQATEQLKGK
jgi:hypothetical protein